jgi:hypothetical protein
MSNKSKKAIKILNQHLTKLATITNVQNGNTWKASLKDTLKLYIGPESSILKRLTDIYFTRKVDKIDPRTIGLSYENVYDEAQKESFRDLILNAILHIESNGIYKSRAGVNIMNGFSNTELISGIVVGAGIVLGIGNYLGKLEKDREIIQFEVKIKEAEKKYQDTFNENEVLKKQSEERKSNDNINNRDSTVKRK